VDENENENEEDEIVMMEPTTDGKEPASSQ
jgi:hypothetical protein